MPDDDDGPTGSRRSHSTSIRRANLGPPPRTTATQTSPIPHRRTGGQGLRPEQTTGSLQNPIPTQAYLRNNVTRQQTPQANILKGKVHWLLPVGIGMIAMLVMWELGPFALAWGLARYDDLRYGKPPTNQTNAVVGNVGHLPPLPLHLHPIHPNSHPLS